MHAGGVQSASTPLACRAAPGLLGILRMAVETRRTALVDLSLDLIQKLLAHGHLAGAVHSISHRRDPAATRAGRKVCCPAGTLRPAGRTAAA